MDKLEIARPSVDIILGWMAVKVTEAVTYLDDDMEINARVCLQEALQAYKNYMTVPSIVSKSE